MFLKFFLRMIFNKDSKDWRKKFGLTLLKIIAEIKVCEESDDSNKLEDTRECNHVLESVGVWLPHISNIADM